jgi:hypothetical protein
MKGYKTGGRQAGTPNKITASIKEAIADALMIEAQNIPTLLASLPPKERLFAFTKLAALIVPTDRQGDEASNFKPIEITANFTSLNDKQ